MTYFPIIFPIFFASIFLLATYIISRMGWTDLASHYKSEESFMGTRIGIISAAINGVNYNNTLVLKINEEGMYLRPIFIFRLFHPPILIPWKEIKEIRDKKILFFNFKELVIGSPFVALIKIKQSTFSLIESNHMFPLTPYK
jgi:hypothetical protein